VQRTVPRDAGSRDDRESRVSRDGSSREERDSPHPTGIRATKESAEPQTTFVGRASRKCLKTPQFTTIVAQPPHPDPLPRSGGESRGTRDCSLALWERVGVRVSFHTSPRNRATIFGALRVRDSFSLPVSPAS
jgi:hypothetical protein